MGAATVHIGRASDYNLSDGVWSTGFGAGYLAGAFAIVALAGIREKLK